MTNRTGAGLILLAVALAAASKGQGIEDKPHVADARRGQAQKHEPANEESTYVIGPEDVLDISVWKEPDFSRAVPVRPDGQISLPLLGDIKAAGLTPSQLAVLITGMLHKYVTQPQVTVIVNQINSRRVYVLGEVNRPGPVSMVPGMTVLQALSSAGGFTQFAKPKGIYVLREENGKEVRYPFNYKQAIRGESVGQNIILKPGDTVVIP
jgi:polysaccharide biosynthesis/export protein